MSSIGIFSLFLMAVSLPLLHFHHALENGPTALIHCHMPDRIHAHHASLALSAELDDVDSHAEALPFEVSALTPVASIQAPDPDASAVLATLQQLKPDIRTGFLIEPDPRAQAPPGYLLHISFRSPPA